MLVGVIYPSMLIRIFLVKVEITTFQFILVTILSTIVKKTDFFKCEVIFLLTFVMITFLLISIMICYHQYQYYSLSLICYKNISNIEWRKFLSTLRFFS